ncbi:MAG: AAA family ATPase [Candidatus Sumerlaeota bacterium]|nr:AAA family ATPase [Candidatus Sumerlaeota bacterium]
MNPEKNHVIGVTGYFASGKDTAAEYIVSRKGFEHLSLSDMIRQRLREEGMEINIPNLTAMGNKIREERGPGALAEMALSAMKPECNYVVTSIRHPAEVAALRRGGRFALVFVDAPIEIRYQRSVARGRAGDCASFEEFKAAEQAQMTSKDSNAQRLAECRDLADRIIVNDSTVESLYARLDEIISESLKPQYAVAV